MQDGDKKSKTRRATSSRGVTMEAVGRMAGVSQVTVSRALSDPSKVSPETLRKINEAIAATGFVPNAIAGALASRRSRLISALVPSIANIVYASMVRAFSAQMRVADYQILLSETGFDPEEEERTIATHLSRRPDAILLTGIHHSARARQMLLASGIPVVEVWDVTNTPIDFCVGFNHEATGQAAADFVHGQGYGPAATVFATDERAVRRSRAFAARFEQLGGAKVISLPTGGGTATLAQGREAMARLIEGGFTRGVVHCSSDVIAHGVITECAARGLSVPGDIAVIGFGDQDFAAAVAPGITTIRVDLEAFGRIAAETLLTRLDGDSDGGAVFDLGFEIIRRQSA